MWLKENLAILRPLAHELTLKLPKEHDLVALLINMPAVLATREAASLHEFVQLIVLLPLVLVTIRPRDTAGTLVLEALMPINARACMQLSRAGATTARSLDWRSI